MIRSVAFVLMLIILFLIGGTTLVWKFLRGYFRGVDVYVLLTIDGRKVAYKNPRGVFGHEDQPLDLVPNEIFHNDRFGTYYSVCWFDCGGLFRCGHSVHATADQARLCKCYVEGALIGEVFEEK